MADQTTELRAELTELLKQVGQIEGRLRYVLDYLLEPDEMADQELLAELRRELADLAAQAERLARRAREISNRLERGERADGGE